MNLILVSQVLMILLVCSMGTVVLGQSALVADSETDRGTLTIHYHRYDGDYQGLGIWTWDRAEVRSPEQAEVFPSGDDDFGKVFTIDLSNYGPEGANDQTQLGLIPRLKSSWDHKDGSDRFWHPNMGNEIWLVGNDPAIYSERPDVSPRIQSAKLDAEDFVTLRFTHPIKNLDAVKSTIKITHANGDSVPIDIVKQPSDYELEVITLEQLNASETYTVSMKGVPDTTTTLGNLLFDPDRYDSEKELGALYSTESTTFRLFSPLARSAWAILYTNPTGDEGRREVELTSTENGLWEATVEGDLHGQHYMVKVDVDGHAANTEVVDIWSKNNTGRNGRGKIVDPRRFDPEGFREKPRPANITKPTDAVIWEVGVRDFTRDESSGVPLELRGKFLGATQLGTTVPGTEIKTGIDYLVELGVTHVQILPIQDFDNNEDNDQYNWGYMTTNFNSPDGWFASKIENSSRISEFKELVQAFHDAGIRVVLDVVYNHTAPNSTFESIAPGYYHRMKPDDSMWNGSGTGNEFNSEAPMARRFIVDSCRYWAEEYKIDGFRFDLMGLVDADTMVEVMSEVQAIDPTLMVYGEPWAAADSGLDQITYKDVASANGIGAFNDHYRNAIKGSPDGNDPGYIVDGRNRDGVLSGLKGSIDDWAKEPSHAIQYMTCHDNLSLWDKNLKSAPNASLQQRKHMSEMGIGILAVSQGVMFLHAASEFGYDKKGEHNSYNQPDEINSIKWNLLQENQEMMLFTKDMIALRKAHPVFRLATADEVNHRFKALPIDTQNPNAIRFTLNGKGLEDESWEQVLVLLNPSKPASFVLPDGDWKIEATNINRLNEEMMGSGKIDLEQHQIMVLSRSAELMSPAAP